MKEFGDWLGDLTRELQEKEEKPPRMIDTDAVYLMYDPDQGKHIECTEDFYEHAYYSIIDNCWKAECRGCGNNTEIYCEPTEFELDNHWGSCSPHCCP